MVMTAGNGSIRVATFDCYGTLIDWEGGAAAFLYDLLLRRKSARLEPGRQLRNRWEAIQFDLLSGPYRPYRDILRESLRTWLDERGEPWDEADAAAFVRAMRSWQPFPDTRPALTRVREAGIRLVIISNTDRDIIAHSLRHLEIPFDAVITAEDCGAYKPSAVVFEHALAEIGEPPDHILHVAFGFKYDIGPASTLGMHTAWINRHGEPAPDEPRPASTFRDLWGVADLLSGS